VPVEVDRNLYTATDSAAAESAAMALSLSTAEGGTTGTSVRLEADVTWEEAIQAFSSSGCAGVMLSYAYLYLTVLSFHQVSF
jgi:hypothetical protein